MKKVLLLLAVLVGFAVLIRRVLPTEASSLLEPSSSNAEPQQDQGDN